MKISACWIAKNEAKNLARSIESVKGIVDEIVVVDTGSTDDTVKIAQDLGARVEYFEWIGDFAAARNYALSQISGDITFFLDADEWFEPSLTQSDREKIEEIFTKYPEAMAILVQVNNLNAQGAVKSTSTANRILRNSPDVCFHKKIHEQFLHKNGATPRVFTATNMWQLRHSGYVEEIFASKMVRNIQLLEEIAKTSNDPEERNFQYCYLVREYFQNGRIGDAMRSLRCVLNEPEQLRKQCFSYHHGVAPLFYFMLMAGSRARSSVSRLELRRKVVDTFVKNMEYYPGIATIELYFDSLFDLKEDALLAKIGPAIEAARKIPDSAITMYFETEAELNNKAAQAAFIRGKLAVAMEYAVKSFKHTENQDSRALHVLLSCLRGQTTADIIVFLNSQFDLKNPQKMEFITTGTRMQGFRDVHAYYLDKRIKAELATKGDYLYFLLLYGKYTEAVEMSVRIYNDDTAETVSQILFLAAVCSGDESIYRENQAFLNKYGALLEAYFGRKPLTETTHEQNVILQENFGLIAFAAGMERADAFLDLYVNEKLLAYQVRTGYCIENCVFDAAASREMPDRNSYACNTLLIQALTMVGRNEEAYELVERLFDQGKMSDVLFRYLLAISDRAQGALKTRALTLYNRCMPLYDYMTDLKDIVNTGYIVDDSDKKKVRTYKSLTLAQFNKQMAEEREQPYIEELAEVCKYAAKKYEEKSMPATAMECYRLALAERGEESVCYERMSELFAKMGNNTLASELRKKAQSSGSAGR